MINDLINMAQWKPLAFAKFFILYNFSKNIKTLFYFYQGHVVK